MCLYIGMRSDQQKRISRYLTQGSYDKIFLHTWSVYMKLHNANIHLHVKWCDVFMVPGLVDLCYFNQIRILIFRYISSSMSRPTKNSIRNFLTWRVNIGAQHLRVFLILIEKF